MPPSDDDGFDQLAAALFGVASMVCAAAGWSMLLHSARRTRGAYILYGVVHTTDVVLLLLGALIVGVSLCSTVALGNRLRLAATPAPSADLPPAAALLSHNATPPHRTPLASTAFRLRHKLHGWTKRGCYAYPLASLIASICSILAMHAPSQPGARAVHVLADAFACALSLVCYSRGRSQLLEVANAARVGELDGLVAWQKPPQQQLILRQQQRHHLMQQQQQSQHARGESLPFAALDELPTTWPSRTRSRLR